MPDDLQNQLKAHFGSLDDAGRLAFVKYFLPQFLHEQSFLFELLSGWVAWRAKAYNTANAHSIEHKVIPAKEPVEMLPDLLDDLGLKLTA